MMAAAAETPFEERLNTPKKREHMLAAVRSGPDTVKTGKGESIDQRRGRDLRTSHSRRGVRAT